MGALRERMAVDLRLRGLSPVTQRCTSGVRSGSSRTTDDHRGHWGNRRSARFSITSSRRNA